VAKKLDRDLVGMNERNGACLRLPASCSLSSYIVLLFESCRRRKQRKARAAARWKKQRWKRAKPERNRRGGLVLVWVVLVSRYHVEATKDREGFLS